MWSIFSKGRRIFFSPNINLVNKGIERRLGSSLRFYKNIENGYSYRWFLTDVSNPTNESDFNSLFSGTPESFGVDKGDNINWVTETKPSYLPTNNFAWEVNAYLKIDISGDYQFNTRSDDGNQLVINDSIITSFYGSRGLGDGENSDVINLTTGLYNFRYRMQQGSGGSGAQVRWKIPGSDTFVIIPSSAFMVKSTIPIIPLTIDIFSTIGTYSWIAPTGINQVEYLVVAGGGGGGNGFDSGGGGGAGAGMVLTGVINVTPGQSYTIVVGSGGLGGDDIRSNRDGADGENSIFGTITAIGGGFGKGSRSATGAGTLGLGGAAQVIDVSSAVGGNGGGGGNSGGGGGGAIGAGTNRTNASTAGIGGSGISSDITGSSLIYGKGGNGGTANNGTINGSNGAANTGNGGNGGSSNSSDSSSGGNGGSGIIVIKYGS
jgi:hypothetical protein